MIFQIEIGDRRCITLITRVRPIHRRPTFVYSTLFDLRRAHQSLRVNCSQISINFSQDATFSCQPFHGLAMALFTFEAARNQVAFNRSLSCSSFFVSRVKSNSFYQLLHLKSAPLIPRYVMHCDTTWTRREDNDYPHGATVYRCHGLSLH